MPDDLDARLVVLGVDHPYSKEPDSAAEAAAKAIFETRGNAPRLYRNTLVFLAADKTRLQDLDEAVRKYLAWESILDEKDELDLSPHQVKQAETQKAAADGAVTATLPGDLPVAAGAGAGERRRRRSTGRRPALRAGRARGARQQEAQKRRICLWSASPPRACAWSWTACRSGAANHVAVRQLVEDFARYLYLPRLQTSTVLAECDPRRACAADVGAGFLRLCRKLRRIGSSLSRTSLRRADYCHRRRCRPARAARDARRQIEQETAPPCPAGADTGDGNVTWTWSRRTPTAQPSGPAQPPKPKRYHGTVTLDPARVGRDAGRIADEVVTHLVGLVGSSVRVTLEIEAEIPAGAPDNVVRTVTENSRTLKFASNSGFEKE